MKFVAAKCPSCQGELQVPEEKDFVKCLYCGVDVKVREAIKINLDANLPNLMELANGALKSGNNEEAYNYFNKILESDIKNYEAWYGKAISAFVLSTLKNPRYKEMFNCFDNAVKYYTNNDIENYKAKICRKISDLCWKYFEFVKNHKYDYKTVDSEWIEHIKLCNNIISSFEFAFYNYYKDVNILKLIIFICEYNFKGAVYKDFQNLDRRTVNSDDIRDEILKKIQYCKLEWRKLDSEYWIKHDKWIITMKDTKRRNNKIRLLSIFISIIIGIILCIVIGKISNQSANAVPSVFGLMYFILPIFAVLGIILANFIFNKPHPPEP